MRVWRSLDEVDRDELPAGSVVTVGNFDGLHLGHRHVIDRVVERARTTSRSAVVVTFDPHPMSVIHPGGVPLALSTLAHRLRLLEQRGVDATLVLPFTTDLARQSPDEFVRTVLAGALRAREVLVGENFRFGHRASGTVETLRHLGASHGFTVDPLSLAGGGHAVWSSTYVRQCLAEGDVAEAATALGRPHRVEGPVVEGDKRGRGLGYPTANLEADERTAIPADGIYAGWLVRASGERLPAAISIGTNPTFGGTRRRVEAYVLDRDDLELYGERVALDFVDRLRDTQHFAGVDELLAQMARDVDQSRALLAT